MYRISVCPIVTRLAQFDFRSKLKTWAYRVAVNYMLDLKKSAVERLHMSFEQIQTGFVHRLWPQRGMPGLQPPRRPTETFFVPQSTRMCTR